MLTILKKQIIHILRISTNDIRRNTLAAGHTFYLYTQASNYCHARTILTILTALHITLAYTNAFGNNDEKHIDQETTLIEAYCNLGQALCNANQIDKALKNYTHALELDPVHITSLMHLGKLHLEHTKDYNQAIIYFEKILHINPNLNNTDIVYLLANAYANIDNPEKAIPLYQQAIQKNPTYIPAYTELIEQLHKQKKIKKAIKLCYKALQKSPSHTQIILTLIQLLREDTQYEAALKQCNMLIQINPNNPHLHLKKAQILTLNNQFAEAIPVFETLSKLQPQNIKITYNIGRLYKKIGEYEKSIYLLKQVKEKEPGNRQVKLSLGESYLALGFYTQGWKEIDYYNTKKQLPTKLKNLTDIADKIIFIQSEWYTEDMIMLIRYTKLLKNCGAKLIIVQTLDKLETIFQSCPYIDKVIVLNRDKIPQFDMFIQISSLPHLFETTLETVPCNIPYLFPDPNLLDLWEQKLHTPKRDSQINKNYNIGIYLPPNTQIPLAQLLEIANTEHTNFYLLSKITEKDHLQLVNNAQIIHTCGKGFGQTQSDIAHLSALLPQLDLLITSDSYVAHLAGALGIQTWVILPKVTSWHWLTNTDKTPWYPTVTLFRQENIPEEKTHSWTSTITHIKNKLYEMISTNTP